MSIKSKNDIPYLKFIEFQKAIEEHAEDEWFVALQVMQRFYPNKKTKIAERLEDFRKALLSTTPAKMNFKLDLQFTNAGKFIDADTLVQENEIIEFLKLVIKPKYRWQRINYNKISLADVTAVLALFTKYQQILKADTSGFTTHLQ